MYIRFESYFKLKFFLILSIILLSGHLVHAQSLPNTIKLSGRIVCTENNQAKPLSYATIRLLTPKDSVLIAGTNSNESGLFELKILAGNQYLLLVSSVGYRTNYQLLTTENNATELLLNDINLNETTVTLKEATVVGKRAEMVVKTDTMEFNAAAYKLRENAVAEDLLKRLPGISITEDGKILVNGKEVKRVMVDGKDFFRSNPNLTIRNIPAGIMEKLQIIEDKSELAKLTGVDDGEENISINISIQKDKKRGWLVSSNVGAGEELNGNEGNLMRYSVNTFAARLLDESQLGIVANGNNINGMSIGSGSSTVGSGKPGLNSSLSSGINFSSGKAKDAPWAINGDISYGFNEYKVRRTSMRQYYLQDSTSYQTDTAQQFTRESGLRFSARIESKALSGWVFSFAPSGSVTSTYRTNTGYSLLQAGNPARDSVNSNHYQISSVIPGFDVGAVLTISHDFTKKGRKLSLSIDSRFSNSKGDGETLGQYYYYRNSPANRLVNRNQQWETNSLNFTNKLYMSYIEPIGEKHSLQFVYWAQTGKRENIKNNYKPDLITGEFTVLDLPYSRSLDNNTLTQQLGVSYKGVLSKLIYTFGLDFNPSFIRSRSFIQAAAASGLDSTITYFPGYQTYNYAPNAYLMYNIGKGQSLRFDYRGRSEAPTVMQLDPSRDESNPTNIKVGNPALEPRFTHWTRLRYNNNNAATQRAFSINMEGNYILNDIINYTNYDSNTGVKTTMPINKSGSWNANGVILYNQPLSANFQLNNYTTAGMRNNIGYASLNGALSSQETVATTVTANEELGITYKWEWLYMMAKASYMLNNTTYSVTNILPKNTSILGGYFIAQFTLPHSWSVSSNLSYRNLTGFSASYNRQEMLWNAEISKNFLKFKAATITLVFNDILQQQLSVSQFISSNYVEDQQFNTLKSFVMLAFSYKFNSMGKTK